MTTSREPSSVKPLSSSETASLVPEKDIQDAPTVPPPGPDGAATLPPSGGFSESATPILQTPNAAAPGCPSVPGYEILGELGRGGMGVVYKARQVTLGRLVALKMILSGGHAGEGDLMRFRTEAEAIARLQHPNIVQIHEIGEQGGLPYFSLEFCAGGSLEKKLNGTPLPPEEAATLVETLARAMQAAHAKGVIHRDLKPANVLLAEDGTPKITDFGLAKKLDDISGQTQAGAIMGTPSYMAPEQAGGKSADIGPAADVYALGAILYECLTGRPPFKAATPLDTILQVVSDEPVPPTQLQSKTPRDMETICLKCLRKEPANRYPSAAALAEDLRRYQRGEPIAARPVGRVERAVKWARRRPAATGLLAVSAVAALGFVLLLDRARREAESRSGTEAELRGQAESQRDQADAAREQSQDTLARSLYEQAHALRLSRQPGWRWQALELLREAEKLRSRPHRKDLSPLAEADQPGPSSRLPTQAELRREAAAALLLEDARPAPPITIAASIGMFCGVSDDGRRALAGFMRVPEKIEPGSEIPMGVRLFDLSNRQQLGELLIPYANVKRMALSPDGTFLAQTEPGRQDVQLRDLPGGTPRATLPLLIGPAPPVAALNYDALVFSPDGRYLAAPRGDGKKTDIFLWDVREPRASRHLARVDAPVGSLSFRGDGRVLAYPVGGNKIALADVTARSEPKIIELPLPLAPSAGWNTNGRGAGQRRLAWGAGSSLLAAVCVNAAGKAAIVVWDTDRQAEQGRWDADFDAASLQMAFSPNGKRLAVGDTEGTIRIYDIVAGAEALRLETHHPGGVGLLRWPTDDHLLTADLGGNSFTTWELSEVSLATILASGKERAIDLAFRPESRSLAVLRGGAQPEIVIIECDSGQLRPKLAVRADLKPYHLLFRPDGQQLALLGVSQAMVWDLPDWREKTYSLAARAGWHRGFPDTAFLSDGRLLVVEQMDKDWQIRLSVRDVVSGQEVGPGVTIALDRHDQPTLLGTAGMKARLSNDGRWLLGFPGSLMPSRVPITIWDVASGTRLGELSSTDVEQTSMMVGTANLSPDSKWLCHFHFPSNDVMSMDFSQARLRVWDVSNRQHHWDMRFAGSPLSMVFSPDSRLLAVAYEEGFVELWDVQRREQFFRWQPLRTGKIGSLTFSSDGAFLACSSERQRAVYLLRLGEVRRHLAAMGLDW